MSNLGNLKVEVINGRVGKGNIFYTPEYKKTDGSSVSQKCVIPVVVNQMGYMEKAGGTLVEGAVTTLYLTAWGKYADTCAKYLVEGKEFTCDAKMSTFMSNLKQGGKFIVDAAGQNVQTMKQSFTLDGPSLRFGADSAAQIAREITDGTRGFAWDGRIPTEMVVAATNNGTLPALLAQAQQHPAAWEASCKALKALTYVPGMTKFGKATVVQPTDANAYGGLAQQVQQALEKASITAPMNINGITYKMLVDAGWKDAQIEASEYKTLLKPAIAPPPPPAAFKATGETLDGTIEMGIPV